MKLILPIPDSRLSANRTKGHMWQHSYKLRTAARDQAQCHAWLALQEPARYKFTDQDQYTLTITVYYRNKIRLDIDNLLSAQKAATDGIFTVLKQVYNLDDKMITKTIIDTSNIDKNDPRLEWGLSVREGTND